MIPEKPNGFDPASQEDLMFEALKRLDNDYYVFHSLRWNDINEKNTVVWGESDFTILHPQKGMIVIEVKSGSISFTRCDLPTPDGPWSMKLIPF